jgi:ketosteroid isomerase-like protein
MAGIFVRDSLGRGGRWPGSAKHRMLCGMMESLPMTPDDAAREQLFKAFARALLTADLDALYRVVTPDFLWSYHDGEAVTKSLSDAAAIAAHLAEQKMLFSAQRFHDVAYHHLPETTFMSFRVSETVRATGAQREQCGIERYSFRDGRIATKDVYRKPIAV